MKKILLSVLCLLIFTLSLQAQVLYGITTAGGNYGGGTINKFIPATNELTVAKSFERLDANPRASLTQASNGKLYGVTNNAIFRYDPSSFTYVVLKEFSELDGTFLHGLMQASDGKLYGTTLRGGGDGNGVIFSFDPSSSTYTKLMDFDNINNGAVPSGRLMQASDGKLYGLTAQGGNENVGVIFSFDPSSSTYTKLKDFNEADEAYPEGDLVQASNGKLYGITTSGGSSDNGAIFSFDPSSSTYTKLKDFDNLNSTNGSSPRGRFILASDGKLYGVGSAGGSKGSGVIFSFDPSSSTYTKLKDFNDADGASPQGDLVQASDGNLYGMTIRGGSSGNGVIFSFDPSSSKYTKLKNFNNADGASPQGELVQASNGKFYGISPFGGRSGNGIIFSFDPFSSTYKILKDFGTNESGSTVFGSLVQAIDGKLYGITLYGGSKGYGVIFSFDPSTSNYKKLKDFDNVSGRPSGTGLVLASDGKLYGTTESMTGPYDDDTSKGFGVIFSFDPSTKLYTKLKDFNKRNGFQPSGRLVEASDGKLYGATSYGGTGNGVIFSFDPSSSTYTKLKDYEGTVTEDVLSGGLVLASNGKLYGGSSGYEEGGHGVMFSFDPSTSTYTELINFPGSGGGPVFQASDGKLYGITSGVIFSFDPASSSYTKLGFAGPSGLMQASDGKLYGTTSRGGTSNVGVIFSFDLSSSTYTKLKDYNGANGANPFGSFIEVKNNQNQAPTVTLTTPTNNTTRLAPAAHIKLSATASDSDGTVTKVEFYNGSNLLHIETIFPYGFVWRNVGLGNYTITAKAYDNTGNVTTSAPVHISVVPNKAPAVSIIKPLNNQAFAAPAYIHFEAAASDTDGRITRVEFYNGTTLLRTEYQSPYTYVWENVPRGTYTITAVATDNWGAKTTSEALTVRVVRPTPAIVSRPSDDNKTGLNEMVSLRLAPNPAAGYLNIQTSGLQKDKAATISVISASGVVMKTMQTNNFSQTQVDVSSLVSGVYTIKIISGGDIMYKQFVKL
jgi:uncharacterized repeat protein (TIGR03803 family)